VFKLGLILNSYAGIGGSLGLKGSDGQQIRDQALANGAGLRSPGRLDRALDKLLVVKDQLTIYAFDGEMGAHRANEFGFPVVSVGAALTRPSEMSDTQAAATALLEEHVDLILFVGGDGTARAIADVIGETQPALGIPSGVKMHSSVFAISPEAAADIVIALVRHDLVPLHRRDVRDLDEHAFRQGVVRAKHYADMLVPEEDGLLQQVKNAGAPRDELALIDLAAQVIETLDDDCLYLVGPGSTTHTILSQMNLDGTLLGVDILKNGKLIARDVSSDEIEQHINDHEGTVRIVVTAIGGQGYVFGRGNQQFTPTIIRRVGKANIHIVAARAKIQSLNGRPLLVDTNDLALDGMLAGYYPVIVGYNDTIMYPVGLSTENLL
jgi:predicted polyphosphate/ATP-dependent NAD kinase